MIDNSFFFRLLILSPREITRDMTKPFAKADIPRKFLIAKSPPFLDENAVAITCQHEHSTGPTRHDSRRRPNEVVSAATLPGQ